MNYIGIDFGDGTTSLAILRTDKNGLALRDEKGNPIRPEEQGILSGDDTTGNTREIPSVMARNQKDPRQVIIGEKAVQFATLGYTLHSGWKTYPSAPRGTETYSAKERERDAKAFMEAIWEHYRKTDSISDNLCVAIGVPSDWSQEDIDKYREWAEAAGIPSVKVIPESTAALLYARKFLKDADGKSLSDTALERGILMIDIGSSTTDFTFARGLSMPFAPYGKEFGARLVDIKILHRIVMEAPEGVRDAVKDTLLLRKENRELKNAAVFSCRRMKERYFTSCLPEDPSRIVRGISDGAIEVGENFLDMYLWEDGRTRVASPRYWDALLEEGCPDYAKLKTPGGMYSWRQLFRKYLEEAREKISGACGNAVLGDVTIVLTGGASRMWFVQDDIRSVFGGDVRIFTGTGNEKSFSVSRGLAWACYAQDRICKKKQTVRDEVQRAVRGDEQLKLKWIREFGTLSSPLSEESAKKILSAVAHRIRTNPASMNTKRKIADYAKIQATALAKDLTDSARVGEIVKGLTEKVLASPEIAGLTAELFEEFGRVALAPKFVAASLDGFVMDNIDIDFDVDVLGIVDTVFVVLIIAAAYCFGFLPGLFLTAAYYLGAREALQKFFSGKPDDVIADDKLKNMADKFEENSSVQRVQEQISKKLCMGVPGMGVPGRKTYRDSVFEAVEANVVRIKVAELDALAGFYAK